MAFSKAFPKRSDKSVYPKWDDITLTDDEEVSVDEHARQQNIALFRECIDDAKKILADEHLKGYETSLISVAISLFEKRASHAVYWKEDFARKKFLEQERSQ